MQRLAPQWLHGCRLRAVLVRADVPQARRASSAPACRSTSRTPPTTTRRSGRGGCRRWRSRRCARCDPDYPLWRDFPYEYEHDRLAIDLINGSDLLRQWVDDPAATPADLDALAAPDEARVARANARTCCSMPDGRRCGSDASVRPAGGRRRHQWRGRRARRGRARPAHAALRAARPRRAHLLGQHQADPRRAALPRVLRFPAGAQVVARARDRAHLGAAHLLAAALRAAARRAPAAGVDDPRRTVPLRPPRAPAACCRARRACACAGIPRAQPLDPRYRWGFVYSDCWVDDARLVVLTVEGRARARRHGDARARAARRCDARRPLARDAHARRRQHARGARRAPWSTPPAHGWTASSTRPRRCPPATTRAR